MLKPDIEQHLRRCFETIPIFRTLHFRFEQLDDGFCRVVVPRQDAHSGLYPTYHGGLLATVADCAAWVAIAGRLGPQTHLTTTDIHIRYLEPCFGDVVAEARVLKFGRTLCPVEVVLADLRGTKIAVAQVTYFRLESEPEMAAS